MNIATPEIYYIKQKFFDIWDFDINSIIQINWWIRSFDKAFEEKNKPSNYWSYELLITRLTFIKQKIDNQDPVEYLIYLYYCKQYSISDIHHHINNELWVNRPIYSLDREFNVFFWWEKRDSKANANTNLRKRKTSESQNWKKEEIEKRVAFILDCLWNWDYDSWIENTNKELLNAYKNPHINVPAYLLDKFWFINDSDFDSFVIELSENFGYLSVSKAIEFILSDICANLWINKVKFSKARICELRKKYN